MSLSGWYVHVFVWMCQSVYVWIRCASVLERLMKSSPKVRCHAVSTAVVQEQSLTSESPPWKPSRNPKEEDKGTAKERILLTQLLSFKIKPLKLIEGFAMFNQAQGY